MNYCWSKIYGSFSKKNIHIRISILETIFCKKTFFCNFNFWTTLFSKIVPNFWRIGAPCSLKKQWFPLSLLIFGQKSCFLAPTIFKIPQMSRFARWQLFSHKTTIYLGPLGLNLKKMWPGVEKAWCVKFQHFDVRLFLLFLTLKM